MDLQELLKTCSFERVSPETLSCSAPFSCDDSDLDEFFNKDYLLYGQKLLGKTYAFRLLENPDVLVCLFSLSNDSIRIKQLLPEDKASIEYVTENGEKNLRRFPGVLIGRLGTNRELAGQGYGSAVMDFIKAWFRSDENKTGCRFIIVDARNNSKTIHYYKKNGFHFLYSNEENEAKSLGINVKYLTQNPLHTRLMFFDLMEVN